MRIAIVGGQYFDTNELDRFLFNLAEKYPDAVIVTGEGRGAEKHTAESAKLLGFRVEQHTVTDQHRKWFGDAALDCQVNTILLDAEIIVLISNGGRCKIALDWWHRMNMHQRDNRGGLVKKKGKYVSLRAESRRIKLFQIATATRGKKTPADTRTTVAA